MLLFQSKRRKLMLNRKTMEIHNFFFVKLFLGYLVLFESNQCRKYKLSLIGSLTIRILLICSSEKYLHIELQQLRHSLHNNGSQNYMINRGINEGKIIKKKNNNQHNSKENLTPKQKMFLTLSELSRMGGVNRPPPPHV